MRISIFALPAAGALVATLMLAAPARADLAGASDHPAVGRYQGATITFYETKEYDETRLPRKPLERADKAPEDWLVPLSGKLTRIGYEGPAGRSVLEVMRNHEAALAAEGFETLMFCAGAEACVPGRRTRTFWEAARNGVRLPSAWDGSTYLLARRGDAASGEVTVAIYGVEKKAAGDRPLVPALAVTVVEATPMERDKIAVVEAPAIERALARDGRIAIYGILFDHDRAELKPGSEPQIGELAALLAANPALAVLIVGHTDGTGGFDYNLTLSQRRAQAVADALAARGVARPRLTPAGAGPVAPVATNRTEDGRARNRRVAIVEVVGG